VVIGLLWLFAFYFFLWLTTTDWLVRDVTVSDSFKAVFLHT